MAYGGVRGSGILGLSIALTVAGGCGGKAADDGSGGAIGAHTGGAKALGSGGYGATGGKAGAGGLVAVTGGSRTTGGVGALTGGMRPISTGGSRSMGGAATGGKIGAGGAASTGGQIVLGGALFTGGKSSTGGAVSTGGQSGPGGASSAGGTYVTGGMNSTGGSATAGGATNDAGDPLTAFCQGDKSKVLYQGRQEIRAPATSYESSLVMDCCIAYGINLHTRDTLGFELDIETLWSAGGTINPGVFPVNSTSTLPMRAVVGRSTDTTRVLAEGTAELFTAGPFKTPFDLGLCLSLYKTETTLYNTLIYVPKVTVVSYESQARFQIYLLSDSTITPQAAALRGLDSVPLASSALLDLSKIAYVSSSASEIGFNPRANIGDSVQTQLKGFLAVPFVVLADGVRVSLGTFVSNLSSAMYAGPIITIEGIKSDSMLLETTGASPNPLRDARTVAALTATGKLIP